MQYRNLILAAVLFGALLLCDDGARPMPREPEPVMVRLAQNGRIRTLPLEDYVIGATAAEMPPHFPAEALKAQAIAIRTLALRNIAQSAAGHGKHKNADLCASPACCMAFLEPETAAASVKQAAGATDGLYLTYEGEPILAVFSTAVRNSTRSCAAVWGGTIDYLVPVSSPENVRPSGHGVGMSQYGAAAMAEAGADAAEILLHYYTGVQLVRR